MITKSEISSLVHNGQVGQDFERLFNSDPNCRNTADIVIDGVPFELKTRCNQAISPITLFSMGEKTLQSMTEQQFKAIVTGKIPNMIIGHYDKIGSEIRYTKIVKWSGFDYSIFEQMFESGIIYRDPLHHRSYQFRVRGHNMSKLAQMFDTVEEIDINDYVKDQNCPNSETGSDPAGH